MEGGEVMRVFACVVLVMYVASLFAVGSDRRRD